MSFLDVFLYAFLGVYEGGKKYYFVQETLICITFGFTLVPKQVLSQMLLSMYHRHHRLDL